MIDIKEKKDCCGCMACVQVCPKQCISIKSDEEGFDYPFVNTDICIDCRLCNKVCPLINSESRKKFIRVYASKNLNDNIRLNSSSGGVFTALAEKIIEQGGIVFGCKFDKNWNVLHSYTDSLKGLAAFRGSKYVQSKINSTYKEVKLFLKSGRKVLFSGTPCQIAALNRYLIKKYPNLLTVEILCHGVPSPYVWQKYIERKKIEYGNEDITRINFRNKRYGWERYHFTIYFNNGMEYDKMAYSDSFFQGFLNNLFLRPSCYSCKCKNGRSGSDITIADYWNINEHIPDFNDNKGINLILTNTSKGEETFKSLNIEYIPTQITGCTESNGGFAEYISIPQNRKKFFKELPKTNNIERVIIDNLRPSFKKRVIDNITKKIKTILKIGNS